MLTPKIHGKVRILRHDRDEDWKNIESRLEDEFGVVMGRIEKQLLRKVTTKKLEA